jgi:hypothetical protein
MRIRKREREQKKKKSFCVAIVACHCIIKKRIYAIWRRKGGSNKIDEKEKINE